LTVHSTKVHRAVKPRKNFCKWLLLAI